MVQSVKSVLLFDYDSICRSLNDRAPGAGDLLGSRAGLWLEAIESGDIVDAPYLGPDARRRFQLKRCYADPRVLGKNRGWLTANGVQIVDCTPSSGLERGAADVHLALDALDAAESEPDEIIVLSAEADLTPLLFRLRAANQKTLIYVNEHTAVSYRTFADGAIDGARLLEILAQPSDRPVMPSKDAIPRPPRISAAPKLERIVEPAPIRPMQPKSTARPRAAGPVDREALAALVRRIHDATSVPLFSPRAFTDLFRLIAEDVRANGFKFASTTDRVTAAMNKLGRTVAKRQIGFVIKGLTLRGHVFGKDDTPERLAETFYEQVLYLVDGTDMKLSPVERDLVQAWIVGFRPEAPAKAADPAPAARPAAVKSAKPQPEERAGRRFRARPAAGAASPPIADEPPPVGRVGDRERAPLRTASRPRRVNAAPEVREEEPAAAAASPLGRRLNRNGATVAPPRTRPAPAPDLDAKDDELEDSILSAIADAVDVLADDNAATTKRSSASAKRGAPIAPEVEPPPQRNRNDDESDEIGDEIQRILASYSQDR